MDTAWIWELSGYCAKYSFLTEPKGLTMREVERIFQLDPEPPTHENLNDYMKCYTKVVTGVANEI